jgi:hypothetical protein
VAAAQDLMPSLHGFAQDVLKDTSLAGTSGSKSFPCATS